MNGLLWGLASVCLLFASFWQSARGYQVVEVIEEYVEMERMKNHISDENEVLKEPSSRMLTSFSWSSCGKASDPTKISSLTVGPDPIKLPGNISISFDAKLDIPLKAPISLDLSIEKKELFWIPIPCVDNVGSCSYSDVCQMLPSVSCPAVLKKYGIPCKCPVKAGVYKLPATTFFVNPFGVPSWLENGEYKVTAKLAMGSQEIACVRVQASLG